MARKPKINVNPGANRYGLPGERIAEFSSDAGGCLISLTVINGRLRIEVYQADDTVDVIVPNKEK